MQIESFGYNTNDVLFFWDTSSNETIDMGSGLELPQFRILGHRTADCTKKYTSGSYTCIKGACSILCSITNLLSFSRVCIKTRDWLLHDSNLHSIISNRCSQLGLGILRLSKNLFLR